MAGDSVDAESRVQLTRMEGKLDLMNERHETMKGDLTEVKSRLLAHGNRLGLLEAKDQQRTGAIGAVKLVWAIGGVAITAVGAAIFRQLGL